MPLCNRGTSQDFFLHMSLLPPIDRAALAALDDRQDQRVEVQIPGGTRLILLRMPTQGVRPTSDAV